MPVLKNPRYEKLAQALASGKTATEAMEIAGFAGAHNSTKFTKKEEIIARVAELQERGAKRAEITIASLTEMLKEDRELARELGQTAAAVSAVDKMGRLHGLVVDKKEVGRPGDFGRMSEDELERFIAGGQNIISGGDSREAPPRHSPRVPKSSGLH